jgi:hypothetical protein
MTDNTMTGAVKLTPAWWRNSRVKITIQLLLIVLFSAAAAIGKQWAPSMQIPGSSGFFWLGPLILGRMVVKRNGAGMLMGAGMAVWGLAVGLDKPMATNFALYGMTGLIIDLIAAIPLIKITNFFGAVICGFAAHMVKFGFVIASSIGFAGAKHFMIVGLAKSAALHAGIGIAASIMAWALYKAGERVITHRKLR